MLQPDKLKKLNENARKMSEAGSSQEDIMAMRDAFIQQFGNEEPLKKKGSSDSKNPQNQKQNTTELPSADGSLATQSQSVKDKQAVLTKKALDKYKDDNAAPFSSPLGKLAVGTVAVLGEANKSIYQFVDDIIVSARKGLQEEGFFDDDIPDTETPITDAIKKKASPKDENGNTILTLPEGYKNGKMYSDGGPLDPTPLIKGTANLALKIINSTLSQEQKNIVISALNHGDKTFKKKIKEVETLQELVLPEDNIALNVTKGIVGMAPDLLAASLMKKPSAVEGRLARAATEVSKNAKPLIQKYAPKAAKFIEEAIRAPFTKIMATKGVFSGIANAEDGDSVIEEGFEGGVTGGLEGLYMHSLGAIAGKGMPVIARGISKSGLNSVVATAIANPLANAGVFTTARALRTGIEEQRLISGEEALTEAGMGIGFSLLHAGSLYKNQKELNHYADNTLKTNEFDSFTRVLNETKDNLEIAYNPNLTIEETTKLVEARDELKEAILKEPDLNNKQLLINEALKIQNQLDASVGIKTIVEGKDKIIESINNKEDLSDEQKSFYTKKVEAIADNFDNSELGLKKKELNNKINEAQKNLDDASLGFTNLKKASDRVEAKLEIDARREELEALNAELTDLIANKEVVQEAVVEQPEGVIAEETITNEKPKGLEPNSGLDSDVDRFETYSGDKFEITLSTVDETGQSLPRGEGKKKIMINVIGSDGVSRTNNSLTKTFETAAEAKEYANKFIARDAKPTETTKEIAGTPDEISQPIELTVPEPKAEVTAEVVVEEVTPVTEVTPATDDKFIIDGKEYTEEEAIEKARYGRKVFGSKMEYNGANKQAIEFVNNYNNRRLVRLENGELSSGYMKQEIAKAFDEIDFAKFSKLFRKHIDPYFKKGRYEYKRGETFKDLASFGIKDGGFSINEEQFRAFAKEAGINVPESNITPVAEEVTPTVKDAVKERLAKIDAEIKALFDRNGRDTTKWVNASDNRDLIALKRAKRAVTSDARTFRTFLETASGVRYLEIDPKAKPTKKTPAEPNIETTPKATPKSKAVEVDPKAEPTVVESAPKPTPKVNKKVQEAENDVEYYDSKIQEIEEEIQIENGNTKDGLVELKEKVKKELEEVKKNKSLSRDEKLDKIEEIKYQIENFKEEQQDIIDSYKEDLKEAKSDYKKAQKRLDKINSEKVITEEVTSEVDDLLNLDTTNKTDLKRVYDYLDRLDKSLDINPNELNDVTRVMAVGTAKAVIKTLKALVNTGITLQQAIKMASAKHKVKEEQIIDAMDIVSKLNENKSEGLSEFELKGYNNLSKDIDKAISNGKTIDDVLRYINKSKTYNDATEVQQELLVREIRKRFGLKEKPAPSVEKLFGKLKDIAKITMTEKEGLIKQIKDLARGGNDAKLAIKEATQALAKEITELREGGKIKKPQEQAILNRLAKTNVLSDTSVRRYIDYVSKVYADAEYSGQLNKAKSIKSDVNSLSKNKDKNASLKELGKEFAKIDPSMVEDIYAYNNIASKVKKAIEGSKIRGQKVNFADTVNIDEIIDYTNKSIESQNEKLREERISELQDLLGVDASQFSAEEIDALLKGEKEFKDDDEKIVRATINKAFDLYSTIINEVIRTGKDVFTGDDVGFTTTQKELVKKFMDMDLGLLEKKEALSAVDALQNFLVNKSTAKMDDVVRRYQGVKNIKELAGKGIKSRELTKYGVKMLGRQLADKITSLPVMFEKMFPGLSRSGEVMNKIGLTELFNKRATSVTQGNNIVDDFVNKFYKKEANGEDYNTQYNITERALAAHAIRSLIGTEEQIQKEFEDRKSLIDQSIDRLSKGNDKEKKLAELYQKAYDKILRDSNNADEVLSKVDNNNKEGVDFWIEEFNKKYDQSADVSENIYNTKLDRDLNYTPMKYSSLSTDLKEVELDNDQSSFHTNNGSVIVPKTGSLNEIQRLSTLPEGKYIDLSFDKNMANSMYDLLTDINTAGPIRQIKAAINSPEFDKLVPHVEDRILLKGNKKKMGRIELYVKNIRNKSPYSTSEDMRTINRVANIGVGQALAGLGQPFKQTIPVAISTLINTKGNLAFTSAFDPIKIAFINNSGYSIANRGRQSQAEIESINRLMEKAEGSFGSKSIKYIEKANELQLKYLLEKPDVFIAKAAWITYYEEALRRQGENVKDIDYSTHELNEEAANYAQRQVDRQQNISDQDLAGRLFTDKTSYAQVLVKMLMPFSSFRMNASAKFGADMITLGDKTSSKEDKAIARRSIAGYAAEMAVFRAVSIGSSLLIGSLVNKYLGKNESDEDFKKRRDAMIKGAATGTFTDLFSPVPVLDPLVQQVGAEATKTMDDLMGTKIAIYDVPKKEFLKEYGTLGISIDRLAKLWTLGNLAATGKYTDDFGREKSISEEDRLSLVPLVPLSLATDVGLAPTEVNTAINYAVKFAKKGEGSSVNMEELERTNPRLYKIIKKSQDGAK